MKTPFAVVVVLLLMVAALAASLVLYPSLPSRMPTHWNLHGQVDGWSDKSWGAFLVPVIMTVFVFFIVAGQWISPLNFKVEPFRDSFNYLLVIAAALVAYLHGVMLWAALHPDADVGRWLMVGIFVFFAWLGNLLGKTRRNFWVGIRTPWTLASERVWIATHRKGAWIISGTGLVGAVAAWLGVSPAACLVLLVIGLLIPVVYSFWLSKKLEREPQS